MSKTEIIFNRCLGDLPGPCQGPYGTHREFKIGAPLYISLKVPNAVQDKAIRWQLRGDPGAGALVDAYKNAGASDLIPLPGLRACCYDVLRTKYYDAASQTWKISGWGHTCSGYFDCFTRYVEALRRDRVRGRIDIAPGVTVPSPTEEMCIRNKFVQIGDMAESYSLCDAADILPTFPGAVDGLANILRKTPNASFYEAINLVYSLKPQPPVIHQPPIDTYTPIQYQQDEKDQEDQKPNWLLYAGGALIAILVLTRR